MLTIPALYVSKFEYEDISEDAAAERVPDGGANFRSFDDKLRPLGTATASTTRVFISGPVIPPLACPALHHKIIRLIQNIRNTLKPSDEGDPQFMAFDFLIYCREDYTKELASEFHNRVALEQRDDPADI